MLLPTAGRAQAYDKEETYNGGAFYELIAYDTYLDELANVLKAVELNRGSASITGGSITNDDFGTSPLGSGVGILIAAGAGYAVVRRKRSRRNTALLLACVALLGLTQCKKEQPLEPQGGKVSITLNVENGASTGSATDGASTGSATGSATDGARANVDPPHVTFVSGDRILVAYDGKYVGYLEHNGSNFSGTIDATGDNTKPLYFYFLGNCVDVSGLTAGSTTSCTANISDQSAYPALPVISFSASNEKYNGAGEYSASLHNKASLMKFKVTTPSDSPICITGMNNKVMIDFSKAANDGENNGFTYDKEGEGIIRLKGGSGTNVVKWAIVLPQDALSAGSVGTAYTTDNIYEGTRPSLSAISANQYLNTGVAMTVNTYTELGTPLTFEATTSGTTVTFTKAPTLPDLSIEYRKNSGAWTTYTSAISLNSGEKVSFRGNNAAYATNVFSGYYSTFSCNKDCYIYGNIMSLISSTDYANAKTLSANLTFAFLFYDNTHIVKHSSKALDLPATTLASDCYKAMFLGCTGLTTAPELPATTLASGCYSFMFQGCTGLTTAPELRATTLASSCYKQMFTGCTGLATAPSLPATTLASDCYKQMFYGCTGLTSAPELSATTLASSCCFMMFYGCTSLTSAPALSATTLATSCYDGMFQGCTSLTTAPALPATTLQHSCYQNMFRGCTKLTTAPALPATTLESSCYGYMFKNCTKLTTAPELPATTLVSGCYRQMFQGCTELKSVTCLATSGININYSTENWLNGVAATGTFTKNASTPTGSGTDGQYWPTSSANGIPSGWTTIIPVVPGKFSVSSTKKVYFAPGNLQYQASTSTWRFATNQYDFVGGADTGNVYENEVKCNNANISGSYTGWIDLFGWGTGNNPTNSSTNNSNYSSFYDWGANAISNGGNTANLWRTLTNDEWGYLINDRTNAANLRTLAIVNGVNGVIIMPDGWSGDLTITSTGYETNTLTLSQWENYEAEGCVFLPGAGHRYGTGLNSPGGYGGYWSSTTKSTYYGFYFIFGSDVINPHGNGQYCDGRSIRLVRNAN